MISLLAKLFIKPVTAEDSPAETRRFRCAYGMLCSIVGICLNVVLFVFKYLAGTFSGSIAITADAFNNLSDAGSSLITLVGFKFACIKPDDKHPFGHGRIEYLSGLAVSMAIIFMGIELAKTSIDKILHPKSIDSGWLVIVILLLSIAVKIYMYFYNNRLGKKFDSAAMRATAVDSLSDCVATTVVLIATVVSRITTVNIDGWCGVAVSLFILYAGVNAARETLSPLLGQPPAPEYIAQIEQIVFSHPEIVGIHDLVVHDYGPGRVMVSLHGEVKGSGDIYELHDVIDRAEQDLRDHLGCDAVIHMDPIADDDTEISRLRIEVEQLVKELGEQVSIHDFRIVKGPTHTNLIFDAVIPYELKLSDEQAEKLIKDLIHNKWSNYYAVLQIDRPYV